MYVLANKTNHTLRLSIHQYNKDGKSESINILKFHIYVIKLKP